MRFAIIRSLAAACFFLSGASWAHTPHVCPPGVPDRPAWEHDQVPGPLHVEQSDLIAGVYEQPGTNTEFGQVFVLGGALAEIRFNACDGQGRPATVGSGPADSPDGGKRAPNTMGNLRVAGPEATSCFGCHAQPRSGGSGDFVANTFNGAEGMDPVTFSTDPAEVNERNTTGMFGSGYIELLGREMSAELQSKAKTYQTSRATGWRTLTTKGVNFDVKFQNGVIVDARGIDKDLIVKPFGAGGTVASIRQFSVQAMNRHHGMQAEESYDLYLGDPDFDEDGVTRELTIGDMTVLALWQALLNMPIQDVAQSHIDQATADLGLQRFQDVGCGGCHTPKMTLNNRLFCEPNPYNPPQIFHDQSQKYCTPLKLVGFAQSKTGTTDPSIPTQVRAFTDLKRHNLCDAQGTPGAIRALCNEQHAEGRPNQDGKPGQEFFLTADLWTTRSSGPYGHDGRYPSVFSIINVHGGEGRASRDAFLALPFNEQQAVVEFLKTLRVDQQRVRVNGES
jgi:mono/diheme cytochrome c family protein